MATLSTIANIYRRRLEWLMGIDPESKPRVYMQVFENSDALTLNYCLELFLSAGIATLGLVLNSPAVVIGAMLVSPLMGPILGGGLALAASDLYLGIKSLLSILFSVAGALLASALLVWLIPFHAPTTEILARTNPNLLDLGVALFSGLAGSIVVCRGGGGGGVTALPGVAIAVALMPPLCAAGFGIGAGFDWPIIYGAGLLFLTNLAAIVASAFLVFYAVRMDAPNVRAKIDYTILENISRERLYAALQKTWLSQGLGDIGKLHWRILMLAVVLTILFVPLSRSLLQVRDEVTVRNTARDVIRELAPAETIVTQQIDQTADRVVIRLIVTEPISRERVGQAERSLLRLTGKEATVVVRSVASDEELTLLRERLNRAPPAAALPADLNRMRADVLARVQDYLEEAWPIEAAPLIEYELGFTPEAFVLRARYLADRPLELATEETISRVLQARLGVDRIRLVLEQERPLPQPAGTRR